MIKILVDIANAGTKQVPFMKEVIKEYMKFDQEVYSIHIIVHSTTRPDLSEFDKKISYEHMLYKPKDEFKSEGTWAYDICLTFKHRQYMIDHINDHDIFIHQDNDHLITQKCVESVTEYQKLVPDTYIVGCLQYEVSNKIKYLNVWNTSNPLSNIENIIEFNGVTFFTPIAKHQGCFICNRATLRRAVDSGKFVIKPHTGPYDSQSMGASDIYTNCCLTKIVPITEDVLIHHLPNKYIGNPGACKITFDNLKEYFKTWQK